MVEIEEQVHAVIQYFAQFGFAEAAGMGLVVFKPGRENGHIRAFLDERDVINGSKIRNIPHEKWFAKKCEPFFIGITDSQWFAKNKIRKPLAIEYNCEKVVSAFSPGYKKK